MQKFQTKANELFPSSTPTGNVNNNKSAAEKGGNASFNDYACVPGSDKSKDAGEANSSDLHFF